MDTPKILRLMLATALVSSAAAVAWMCRPGVSDSASARTDASQAAPTDCSDARCAARRVIGPASTSCASAIEQLAAFGARWTDTAGNGPRFDRFAWLRQEAGTIVLAGRRAEFRNGADAYLPVDYECDFDPARLAVLDVRARPRAASTSASTSVETAPCADR